jgi:hypothetical protein
VPQHWEQIDSALAGQKRFALRFSQIGQLKIVSGEEGLTLLTYALILSYDPPARKSTERKRTASLLSQRDGIAGRGIPFGRNKEAQG